MKIGLNKVFGLTHTGKVRKQNQDYFRISDDKLFFVVADGMGGHLAGEIASEMAVKCIAGEYEKSKKEFGNVPEENIEEFLTSVIRKANREVKAKAEENPEFSGMGTTIALVLTTAHGIYTSHVGDTRIYLISGHEINQIGTDHSFVAGKVKEGLMTREEARVNRYRNILTSAIGASDEIQPEFNELMFKKGDKLLICSDGLWDMVPDEMILKITDTHKNPEIVCKKLLNAALAHGGKDNITIIFMN